MAPRRHSLGDFAYPTPLASSQINASLLPTASPAPRTRMLRILKAAEVPADDIDLSFTAMRESINNTYMDLCATPAPPGLSIPQLLTDLEQVLGLPPLADGGMAGMLAIEHLPA